MKRSISFKICSKLYIIIVASILATMSVSVAAQVNYELVLVGDPGNPSDVTSFGRVEYTYQIGKYEVTIGQYTAFLNAVATESDPYGLWNQSMKVANIQGINRTGSLGSYSYSVMNTSSTGSSSESMPISGVSWFNVARFANWMANGQPIGPESSGTTESGAYNLNGINSGAAVVKNTINPNTSESPTFYIPSENEWYKAAYYGGNESYYVFATQSNTTPSNVIGSGVVNHANFLSDAYNGYCVPQSQLFSSTQTYLTDVGLFTGSGSYYGTFDQTGSVWEWTDLDRSLSKSRGLRGAAWTSVPPYMQSSYRLITVPSTISVNVGFRLAAPSS